MNLKDIKKAKKPLEKKEVWKEREFSGSGMMTEDKKEKEPSFMSEKWRTKKLNERTERLQAKQERIEAKRELQRIQDERKFEKQKRKIDILEHKRDEKLKKMQLQMLKTQSAELKKRERAARFGGLKQGAARVFESSDVKSKAMYETAQYKRQQVGRDREKMRRELEADREYQRKFGVTQEGQGELPYYEKEHGKPLPCKPCDVTKPKKVVKKSFKDNLF
jgi:hypothetical protein